MRKTSSILHERGLFWLSAAVITIALIWLLKDILPPFVTGLGVAYLLNPLVTRLTNQGLSRAFATTLVLLMFLVILLAIIFSLSPVITRQVADFIKGLPTYYESARLAIQPYIHDLMGRLNPDQVEQIKQAAGNNVGTFMQSVQSVLLSVWDSGMAVIDIITFLVITPVVAFYCLRDWPLITRRVDALWPRDQASKMREIFTEFDLRLSGFLRGQLLVCICLGTFYAVALSIAGVKFGLAIGFIAGILSFIPYIGSTFGLFASVGMALAQSNGMMPLPLIALGIFAVGQFIEGNFLTPKLVGERIGLHAVWVIFALMAGGKLFGFTGLLLAVPVAAMVGVLVRHALQWYENSALYAANRIIH
jgi:predicted PurR-regulated permease PerM